MQGHCGGTTVSATMLCAHKAGIEVFVTGGIGGVHREGENSKPLKGFIFASFLRRSSCSLENGCQYSCGMYLIFHLGNHNIISNKY